MDAIPLRHFKANKAWAEFTGKFDCGGELVSLIDPQRDDDDDNEDDLFDVSIVDS